MYNVLFPFYKIFKKRQEGAVDLEVRIEVALDEE